MNIFRFCVAVLVTAGLQNLHAQEVYTQRTQISRVAPEILSVFERETAKKSHSGDLLSCSVMVMASRNFEDGLIGNYFGAHNNKIDTSVDVQGHSYDAFIAVGAPGDDAAHISSRSLVHSTISIAYPDYDSGLIEGRAKINLNPEQRTQLVGLNIAYRFSSFFERFYCSASVPFVRVGSGISLYDRVQEKFAGIYLDSSDQNNAALVSIRDFFSGAYANSAADNHQEALAKAKLDGVIRHKTGFSDIKLKLGCFLLESEKVVADVWAGVLIPAGNRQTMEFLLEPVTGNNGHAGLSVGGNAAVTLWDTDSARRIQAYLQGEVDYLFAARETRIVGFNSNGKRFLWDIYRLGAVQGGTVMFPMANILARPVMVSPGLGGSGAVGVKIHGGFLKTDFSYSFYARQGEKVGLPAWEDNKYALVADEYDATNPFDIATHAYVPAVGDPATGPINTSDLITGAATTPHIWMHGVNAAIGLGFEDFEWSPQLSVGMHYSVPTNNSAFKSYAAWIKGGISF